MKRFLYFGLIALSLFMMQCSSSQKLLSDGNYEKAYKVSLKELKKGKGNAKASEILNASLDKIYDEKIESILESENGETLDDGVAAYNGYQELVSKYEPALKYLSVENNERYTSTLSRKENLGLELYEDYKKHGLTALQISKENGNRQAGRKAYENFEKAQQYNPSSEINDLLDEAYELAITIIVVETSAPYNGSYDFDIEREFKRVENVDSKFQKFFFERNQSDADCIIQITFEPFDFQSDFRTYSRNFSADVPVERTITNASGETTTVTDTERVSCILNTERTISQLAIYADISIIAQTDYCKSSRDTYRDFHEEVFEEYRVSGDRRALPSQYNTNSNGSRIRDSDLVTIVMRRFYSAFSRDYL